MRSTISAPIVGQSLSASWGKKLASDIRANRVIAGKGVYVSYTSNGTIINCDAEKIKAATVANENLKPFTVRYHQAYNNGAKNGPPQLEIYLPSGSMTTESDCVSINRLASVFSGHEDEDGWFLVEGGNSLGYDVSYSVWVNVMPGCHMIAQAYATTPNDEYYNGHICGFIVAHVKITKNDKGEDVASITQIHSGSRFYPVEFDKTSKGPFALYYRLLKDTEDRYYVDGVYCIHKEFSAGGLPLHLDDNVPKGDGPGPEDTKDVKNESAQLWLIVNHSGTAGEDDSEEDDQAASFSIEVKADPSSTENTDDQTCIKLFDLNRLYPTADYRDNLKNIAFYR